MIHLLEIEIDALTESVVEVSTGKIHKTHVSKASLEFLNTIHKKNGWKFNWKKEAVQKDRNIFKLILKYKSNHLLGLISIEKKTTTYISIWSKILRKILENQNVLQV
jgi:hypothetical protein